MSQEWITVTCQCGHETRAYAAAAKVGVRCPACGVMIQPGGASAPPPAAGGTACPHCGSAWPRSEARCPSCLARSRVRKQAKEDLLGDARRKEKPAASFSQRWRNQSRKPDESAVVDPLYEAPPDETPATLRVKHWYQKPSTWGWPLAAGVTALAGLQLGWAAWSAGSAGGWSVWPTTLAVLAGLAALVALGVYRGGGGSRFAMLVLPVLLIAGGAITLMAMIPGSLRASDLVGVGLLLAWTVGALAVLTPEHGRLGTVVAGGPAAVLGLVLLGWALGQFRLETAQQEQLALKVDESLAPLRRMFTRERRGLPEVEEPEPVARRRVGPTAPQMLPDRSPLQVPLSTAQGPGVQAEWSAVEEAIFGPVEVKPAEPAVIEPEPAALARTPTPVEPAPAAPAPVRPPWYEPEPASPAATVTPEPVTPEPVTPEPEPAEPAPPAIDPATSLALVQDKDTEPLQMPLDDRGQPVDGAVELWPLVNWRDTLLGQGYAVRFPSVHTVEGYGGVRHMPDGDAVLTYFRNQEAFSACEVFSYRLPPTLSGDAGVVAAGQDVASLLQAEIQGEMWRPGPDRRRLVRLRFRRDGRPWIGRVEIQRVGDHAVVVAGLCQEGHAIGLGKANQFVTSFRLYAPAAAAAAAE